MMTRQSDPLWDREDTKIAVKGGLSATAIVLIILGVCSAFSLGGFLLNAAINQHVVQPVIRQNQNHDADWMRAKTAEVTNLWHDFQNAQQSETADVTQIHVFIKVNGPLSTYPFGSPVEQQYMQLFTKYQGDYQAEVTDAQLYDADRLNPDYQPIWEQSALANFPQLLDAGLQPPL